MTVRYALRRLSGDAARRAQAAVRRLPVRRRGSQGRRGRERRAREHGSPSSLGRDGDDPLFLQIKEAQPSVLEPYLGKTAIRTTAVASSRASGSCSRSATSFSAGSAFEAFDGRVRDYYVRQLWDGKFSADHRGDAAGVMRHTRSSAAGRSRACTPARATGSRSPPILALAPVRRGDRGLLADIRRPERARLRRSSGGRRVGPGRGRDRPLTGGSRPTVGPPRPWSVLLVCTYEANHDQPSRTNWLLPSSAKPEPPSRTGLTGGTRGDLRRVSDGRRRGVGTFRSLRSAGADIAQRRGILEAILADEWVDDRGR